MSYASIVDFYKGTTELYELISINHVEWLMWSVKLLLLGLLMKYGKWECTARCGSSFNIFMPQVQGLMSCT